MRRLQIIGTTLITLGLAASAAAQGRVMGVVRDTSGEPVKGATIRATNTATSGQEWTSTTDDKGRFVILGMRVGPNWTFVAEAPGYEATEVTAIVRSVFGTPMRFTLRSDPGPVAGALARDIMDELAEANALRDAGRYDEAIAAYQEIQSNNPTLTALHLVIAGAYRQKAEQARDDAARQALLERASAAYDALLEADADNARARTELAAVRARLNELK